MKNNHLKILITGGSGFIGTNAIKEFIGKYDEIVNLDTAEPLLKSHSQFWQKCDIRDNNLLVQHFHEIQPTHVLHLAARTDCVENVDVYKEYDSNIIGTENVVKAIQDTESVQRAIITSSQYVCGPQHYPKNMDDYAPHTVYGQSKVLTEKITKELDPDCIWTIIRPTNIWGPWHMRYRREAWNVMKKGRYLHPAGDPVIRCYGYVGTVIEYINKIFNAKPEVINKKVFYVGDEAIDIYEWANGFNEYITGKKARKVPCSILRFIAIIGDIITMITGEPFPLTTSRFVNMTSSYLTPVEETFKVLGRPVSDWRTGIKDSIDWVNEYGWP